MTEWSLLSSYGAVILYVAKHSHVPLIEIAQAIGVRERNVAKITAELVQEGHLKKERVNKVNKYEVNYDALLRRPMFINITLGKFLKAALPLVKEREIDR